MLYILDYDGTLRSLSFMGIFQGYRALIRQLLKQNPDHFFPHIEGFREWFNPFWPENLRRLGIDFSEEVDNIFREQYAQYTYIFPWVEGILRIIARNNQLAICSTACSQVIENELGKLVFFFHLGKLASFFPLIIGSDNVNSIKPNPEGIRLILEQTGDSPENVIIIGDTKSDILAGKAAGIKTGAVTWGLDKEQDLIALEPDYVFYSGRDLLNLVIPEEPVLVEEER